MIQIEKLAHVTHAVLDRAAAKALYQRILGATVFYEGRLPAQGRESSLLLVHDLCVELIDVAPKQRSEAYTAKHGGRFHSITLRVRDMAQAAEWLQGHGVRIVERHAGHFAIDPASAHGVRMEFTDAAPPGDPRGRPGWRAHGDPGPIVFDGLWSVTLLVDDVPKADRFFRNVLGARQIGERLEGEHAQRSKFYAMGTSRVVIMVPKEQGSQLTRVVETQGPGIHGVCLTTTDPEGAGRYLRAQGLGLLGSVETRLTTHPHGFMGARYLFMRRPDPSDPLYVWEEPLPAREG